MERVGVYRVLRELGRGASGVVYEAEDERLGRRVALKVLAEELVHDHAQRTRFEREARILAALDHPNVARLYEVEDAERGAVLVLEFVEGENLDNVLARGPLELADALDVARQVADGLEAAHEAGVVHRDLKPANVILSASGTAKILDFGLARDGATDGAPLGASAISSDGVAIGTPVSMAPEQLRGKPLDRRADVWAFGCFLHHLLTGRSPFARQTTADVVSAILEEPWNPASLPPSTPASVRALLGRCFEKDPRSRLRDLGEARVLLERIQHGRPEDSAPVASARRPWAWVAGAALAGLALGWTLGGGSTSEADASTPGTTERMVVHVPDLERVSYPRLLPDGSGLVYEVMHATLDGDVRALAVRRFDSFREEVVVGSEHPETFDFTADGNALVLVRGTAGTFGPLTVTEIALDGERPPRELGALPPQTDRSGSVAVLVDGTVAIGANPANLLLLAGDGSGECVEVALEFEGVDPTITPDVLDAIPGTRGALGRSWEYREDGIVSVIVTIDCDSGRVRPLIENAGHAQVLPSGRLLFSRAGGLLVTGFDFDTWAIEGPLDPVAAGLHVGDGWDPGSKFHASSDGKVLWRPGSGDVPRRVLWRMGSDRPPQVWVDEPLPYLGSVNADQSSRFLTATVRGAGGTYEIWGTEVAEPALRRLLGSPSLDFVNAEAVVDRNELYYLRFGRGGTVFGRVPLDAPSLDREHVIHRSDDRRLRFLSMSADARRTFLREASSEGVSLMVVDATDPSSEPRHLLKVREGLRDVECTSDGRWISYRSLTSGTQRLAIRRVKADGLGPELVVPGQGAGIGQAWWKDDGGGGQPTLLAFDAEGRSILAFRLVGDADRERLEGPTTVLRLEDRRLYSVDDLADGSFVGLLVDEHETRFDSLHLLLGAWSD